MFPSKDHVTKVIVENIVGKGKKFDDIQDSWFIKHLIIALREAVWAVILVSKTVYDNLAVRTSSGLDLDDKGYDFGVDRKEAVKAVHTVTLHKSASVSKDTIVPDGFLLSTTPVGNKPPIKFVVSEGQKKYIPKGEKCVEGVLVECIEYGVVGNVSEEAINLVAQAGFDYVSDSKIYIAGVEAEYDDSYRQRILERKRRPSRAGTPSDWEIWALEVEGVFKAKCFRCARGPGTADIVIWGENSSIPTDGLVKECQKYIDEKYMPADLDGGAILVFAPEAIPIDITICDVILKEGYAVDSAISAIKNSFDEYFQSASSSGGITVVDCIVCIRNAYDSSDAQKTPIIQDFKLVSPSQNIVLSKRQSPFLQNVTIDSEAV